MDMIKDLSKNFIMSGRQKKDANEFAKQCFRVNDGKANTDEALKMYNQLEAQNGPGSTLLALKKLGYDVERLYAMIGIDPKETQKDLEMRELADTFRHALVNMQNPSSKNKGFVQMFANKTMNLQHEIDAKYGEGSAINYLTRSMGYSPRAYFDQLGIDYPGKEKAQEAELQKPKAQGTENKNEKSVKSKEPTQEQIMAEMQKDFEHACYRIANDTNQGIGARPYDVKMAKELYDELEVRNGSGTTFENMKNMSQTVINMEKETGMRLEEVFQKIGIGATIGGNTLAVEKKPTEQTQHKGEFAPDISLEPKKPVQVIESTPASPQLIQQLQSNANTSGITFKGMEMAMALPVVQGVINQMRRLEEMLRTQPQKGR